MSFLEQSGSGALRIIFVLNVFPALSETFILNQITGLIDRGHDVGVFAQRVDPTGPHHPDVARYGLLEKTRVPDPLPTGRARRLLYAARASLRLVRTEPSNLVRMWKVKGGRLAGVLVAATAKWPFDGQSDIVQCHFGTNGTLATALRDFKVIQGRILTMFHGVDIRAGIQDGGQLYESLRNRGDLVLSISPYNRTHLLAFGIRPEQIVDHPVGIDVTRFSRRAQPRGPSAHPARVRLTTVARLVEVKGLAFGLRAVRRALDARPGLNIQYSIIGDGPLRRDLEQLVTELSLETVVRFCGACDHEEVARQLAESELFLLPSLSEALPTVLMEAGAAELPVVATDVGSVTELVLQGKTGYVVAPGDDVALADRLVHLFDHPELWGTMGRAGSAHIQANYDIEMLNDRLVDIYRSTIERT